MAAEELQRGTRQGIKEERENRMLPRPSTCASSESLLHTRREEQNRSLSLFLSFLFALLVAPSVSAHAAAVVRYHHERWQGTGPAGLVRERIPQFAQKCWCNEPRQLKRQHRRRIFDQTDNIA